MRDLSLIVFFSSYLPDQQVVNETYTCPSQGAIIRPFFNICHKQLAVNRRIYC